MHQRPESLETGLVWQHVMPALGGLKQEDHWEFKASLGYRVKPCLNNEKRRGREKEGDRQVGRQRGREGRKKERREGHKTLEQRIERNPRWKNPAESLDYEFPQLYPSTPPSCSLHWHQCVPSLQEWLSRPCRTRHADSILM